jgi:ribonuclease E
MVVVTSHALPVRSHRLSHISQPLDPLRAYTARQDVAGRPAGKDNMAKKMLIDATHPEETRVVVVDGTKVEEFDFESLSKRQLAGNIYLAKVTRVEPSLQAAFVDYGGNRHGFLAFSEIHPDYYQIPVADREALLAEEREYAEAMAAEAEEEAKPKRRRSRRRKSPDTKAETTDADAVTRGTPSGMDVVEFDDAEDDAEDDGQSRRRRDCGEHVPRNRR